MTMNMITTTTGRPTMISSNKKVVLIKRRFGGKERILVEEFGGQELLDASNEPGQGEVEVKMLSPKLGPIQAIRRVTVDEARKMFSKDSENL